MAEPQEDMLVNHGAHAVHDFTTPEARSSLRKKSRLDSPDEGIADAGFPGKRQDDRIPAMVKDVGRLANRLYYGSRQSAPETQAVAQEAGGDSGEQDGESVQAFHSIESQSSNPNHQTMPNGNGGDPALAKYVGCAGGDSRSSGSKSGYGPVPRGREREEKNTSKTSTVHLSEELEKARIAIAEGDARSQRLCNEYNASIMEYQQSQFRQRHELE